ncbi:MAG: sodium-dependent transporter [Gemmatimonadota bacterium]
MTERVEQFTTRWGMLVAMLGMAVGTGNIWRFPRVVATNGGGSFLVAWVVFLLIWSVPLILVEFAMGKATRSGNISGFARMMGKQYAWMGAWVAFVTTVILFYYIVVAGWTIRYSLYAATGRLADADTAAVWAGFSYTWEAVIFQVIALGIGVFVVARGVRGIEAATRLLIPSLAVLVLILAIRAVTLPGAVDGLNFMFTPSWSGPTGLSSSKVWLEALTQNAWDTGAGWGMIMVYAIYMKKREDTALNAFALGFANNSVSLLAGIMVLCTVFSLMPDAAMQIVGAGNEGLTFIWVPQLFATMPGGRVFMVLFFVALFFAAVTSVISMVELAVRNMQDLGVTRSRALVVTTAAAITFGIPSALDQGVFGNQDFVWGVALMVSGLFFALAVLKYGVTQFRESFINTAHSDIRIGAWWDWVIRLVVVQALVLIVWWFWQVRTEDPWGAFGWANMATQWAVALAFFFAINGWLGRTTRVTQDLGTEAEG